jgi:hypothetical protein
LHLPGVVAARQPQATLFPHRCRCTHEPGRGFELPRSPSTPAIPSRQSATPQTSPSFWQRIRLSANCCNASDVAPRARAARPL